MNSAYDIAIVGSGFGGSLLAMIAQRLGRSVVLLEKGKHPRFAIGESSTPLSNILFEQLTTRYDLRELTPLAKWGSWQRAFPQVACGLKRGFSFYHHTLGAAASTDPEHRRQLLVAASPHDGIADTHWYREEFDHLLVQEAQKLGVEYRDEVTLRKLTESDEQIDLQGERRGEEFCIQAKFLVDATGPRGFLHHALGLGESPLHGFPATQALFSHFTGVGRIEDDPHDGKLSRNRQQEPPYPVDDAAVHHVFDGGWIWILKFNNGITSAGVAATDAMAQALRFPEGESAWQRLVDSIPTLKKQFANARPTRSFTHMPRLAFRSKSIAGKRWALLPSAAGFVDPLLSTGFPLTLLGVTRLAELIQDHWDQPDFSNQLQNYAEKTDSELVAASRLIGGLYRTMDRFPLFVAISMLYFAAASFAESARRLHKAHLAPSFLLHDNPRFGPAMQECLAQAAKSKTETEMHDAAKQIATAIEPINIAGLCNDTRNNWYPVDAQDLFENAYKVDSAREEIKQLLESCGFWEQRSTAV